MTNETQKEVPIEVKKECDDHESELAVATISPQARKAIDALIKYYADKDAKAKSLFPESDHGLYLQVVYKKASMDKGASKSKKIRLPYSFLMPPNATVCLIVKDRNRDDRYESDVDKQARQWADELFREQGITSKQVTKIITKRQLEREYHTFNERRELLTAYDVYLIDSRVHKSVLTFIGTQLHRSNKCAIAVHMDAPLLPQITNAFHKTSLDLSPFKTRISIQVGHLAMNGDQLSANVDACLLALWRQCPGGGADNIHAIYLQPSNSSPSLPIYAHFGSANHVQVHKNVRSTKHNRRTLSRRAEIRDELTCLPDGLEVIVRPNGRVRVVNAKTKKGVVYPTVNDEVEPWDDLKPTKDPIVIERKRMRRKRQIVEKAKKRIKMKEDDFKFEPLAVGSVVSVDN